MRRLHRFLIVVLLSGATTFGCASPAIMRAAHQGDAPELQRLIKNGADVNLVDKGWTPLLVALGRGALDASRLLIESGANVTAKTPDGKTTMFIAAHGGFVEICSLLLKKGADVNVAARNGDTPLMAASVMQRTEAVKFLLDNGAKIDSIND